jgi:hypothetical protein
MTLWKMTYIIFHHFVVLVFFMLKKMGYNTCYCADLYDSVAGNHSNLGCYLIWNSNLSTYMCLEYLISFRLSANVQGNRFSKIFLSLNCDLVYSHRNRAE